MKNLLTILLLLYVNLCFSQIQKGTIVIGGGLNLTGTSGNETLTYNDEKSSNTYFGINTSYEKFTNNTLSVGFNLAYSYSRYSAEFYNGSQTQEYGNKRNMVYLGPTATKYVSLRDKLYLTIGSSLAVGYGTEKDIDNEHESQLWSAGISFNPGLAFFLNDNFALSAGIGSLYYRYETNTSSDQNVDGDDLKDTQHNYGLTFSLNTFNIGLRYYFRTAKSE